MGKPGPRRSRPRFTSARRGGLKVVNRPLAAMPTLVAAAAVVHRLGQDMQIHRLQPLMHNRLSLDHGMEHPRCGGGGNHRAGSRRAARWGLALAYAPGAHGGQCSGVVCPVSWRPGCLGPGHTGTSFALRLWDSGTPPICAGRCAGWLFHLAWMDAGLEQARCAFRPWAHLVCARTHRKPDSARFGADRRPRALPTGGALLLYQASPPAPYPSPSAWRPW